MTNWMRVGVGTASALALGVAAVALARDQHLRADSDGPKFSESEWSEDLSSATREVKSAIDEYTNYRGNAGPDRFDAELDVRQAVSYLAPYVAVDPEEYGAPSISDLASAISDLRKAESSIKNAPPIYSLGFIPEKEAVLDSLKDAERTLEGMD